MLSILHMRKNTPAKARLGMKGMIPGFEEGLSTMKPEGRDGLSYRRNWDSRLVRRRFSHRNSGRCLTSSCSIPRAVVEREDCQAGSVPPLCAIR